jgi:hypothetical protein
MTRTQSDRTSPLCLVKRKQDLCALVAGLLGLCLRVEAGLIWDSRASLVPCDVTGGLYRLSPRGATEAASLKTAFHNHG